MSVEMPPSRAPRANLAGQVTAQIVELLANGVRPWEQPWSTNAALGLPLRSNGIAYRGVNVLILWAAAHTQNFAARRWLSFKQARELGGCVRRGERATKVIFYAPADKRVEDAEHAMADGVEPRRAVLRAYSVFNADQIEGLEIEEGEPIRDEDDGALSVRLTRLFVRVPALVRHGGDRAYYAPEKDFIQLPSRASFHSNALYFSTLAHEIAHWSGHPTRLDRDLQTRATPIAYAREELVAELAAAFLGAELGLASDHIESHSSYIDHYLRILDREPGALLPAAGRAQAVVDYLRPWLLPAAAVAQVDSPNARHV